MSLFSSPNSGTWSHRFSNLGRQRGMLFGAILMVALIAFEVFNYSTTDYALADLLGDLNFLGLHWSTILAIAFCGIDFAGIARLFTPEMKGNGVSETWYLFGAWLLAATMNALLTWWGVSIALISHQTRSTVLMDAKLLFQVVPVFVAVMVWLIRILIIGSFSVAGDRLISLNTNDLPSYQTRLISRNQPVPFPSQPLTSRQPVGLRTSPKNQTPPEPIFPHSEPVYQDLVPRSASAGSSIHRQQF